MIVATIVSSPFASAAGAAPASGDSTAAGLRAQADALASRYFDALTQFQSLDAEIAQNQHVVDELTARANQARADARARALVAYKTSGSQLSAMMNGDSSLDASRRARLIDQVNATDVATYAKLHAATRDLHRQQHVLEQNRRDQADALAALRDQGGAIDAKLAQAEQLERAAAVASAAAAGSVAATPAATATTGGGATTTAPATTGGGATTGPAAPAAPAPPPDYSGTAGTSPHHDDPFLTCVRQRESGGRYDAVNPAGPYLGAYQFLQATWNVTASHAGRAELVGVPANVASPYDQDEIAWALYQWQGAGPWGGSCP
jgi:peptidoglycan hydrolase CwlO-like protein